MPMRARDINVVWELGYTKQAGADAEKTALQLVCQLQTTVKDIALDSMALEGLEDDSPPGYHDE